MTSFHVSHGAQMFTNVKNGCYICVSDVYFHRNRESSRAVHCPTGDAQTVALPKQIINFMQLGQLAQGASRKKSSCQKRVLEVFTDVKLKSNRGLPERCGAKSTIQIAKNRKNRFLPEEIAFFVFLMNFSGPNTFQSA